MYVRATSPRLSRGKSTPATRAIFAPSQPWRWLCRGFLQITRTTPDRRTILQFSQRTLTDGRTFTMLLPTLFEPICDPAAGQVVGRQLDLDPVTGKDADEVHAHLAAHVGEHPVAVLQLHAEHRVRQGLDHGALNLDRILFGHAAVLRPSGSVLRVRISGPSSVTAVHRSSRTRTSQLPIVTIGSIASTMPGLSCGPRPGSPKFGTCGSSCRSRPIPCPTNCLTTAKPCASTCCWTACETSDSRRPGQHAATARARLSRVTSRSSRTRGATSPTARVRAQSA